MGRNGRSPVAPEKWRSEAPRASIAQWGQQYDRFFKEAVRRNPNWHRWYTIGEIQLNGRQNTLFEQIRRLPGTVLDIGCGPGFLVGALLSIQRDAYGCDCSKDAIAFALKSSREAGAGRFFHANLHELPRPDAPGGPQYDTVVCSEVLEHVVDPETALRHAWECVKPGGKLLVTVPVARGYDNPEHLHDFNEAQLTDLMTTLCVADDEHWPFRISLIEGGEKGRKCYLAVVSKQPVELKWALVNGTAAEAAQANDIAGDHRLKTGLFNWIRVWQGFAVDHRKLTNPDAFDVLHVQLSGTNFEAIWHLRQMLGPDAKTKIVVNLDYALEWWYMYPPYPHLLIETLQQADHIMAVEPVQQRLLAELLGRPVHLIAHPTDADALRRLTVPIEQRTGATIMEHRDQHIMPPYWMVHGFGFTTRLIGHYNSVAHAGGQSVDWQPMYYDYIHEGYMGGEQVVANVAASFLVVDAYTHHVAGRSALEAAGTGVPCIGYDNVWAQRHCFPQTTVRAGDVPAARKIIQRLIDDADFYRAVSGHAQQAVGLFDYQTCKERYLYMLQEGVNVPTGPRLAPTPAELRPAVDSQMESADRAIPGDPDLTADLVSTGARDNDDPE